MWWECISDWIEHHPGLASWVQAVGAIAAIGIAIWVPGAQRRKEIDRAEAERKKVELAKTEQLLILCKELRYVADVLPSEYVGADYSLTNEMSKQVISDQIDRLNHYQKEDQSADRLELMLKLRIELYDWLKFFSEIKDHEGLTLFNRSERTGPRLEELELRIANLKRRESGQPELDIPDRKKQAHEEDPPW